MVKIPSGSFRYLNDEINVNNFALGKYPVTFFVSMIYQLLCVIKNMNSIESTDAILSNYLIFNLKFATYQRRTTRKGIASTIIVNSGCPCI